MNLVAGWEPSGPGTARVDDGATFEVRWHRALAMVGWIAYWMVLAQDDDGLRDVLAVLQRREDYTPPAADLRPLLERGAKLTVVFSGYGGDAAWEFDLAAVRAEAAACSVETVG